jgi:hypothetical protein
VYFANKLIQKHMIYLLLFFVKNFAFLFKYRILNTQTEEVDETIKINSIFHAMKFNIVVSSSWG